MASQRANNLGVTLYQIQLQVTITDATTSGHCIHCEEPQLVVGAILKLVNAARSK